MRITLAYNLKRKHDEAQAELLWEEDVERLLGVYPDGLDAEEFIPGREMTVPMLDDWPGQLLEIIEHTREKVKNDEKTPLPYTA